MPTGPPAAHRLPELARRRWPWPRLAACDQARHGLAKNKRIPTSLDASAAGCSRRSMGPAVCGHSFSAAHCSRAASAPAAAAPAAAYLAVRATAEHGHGHGWAASEDPRVGRLDASPRGAKRARAGTPKRQAGAAGLRRGCGPTRALLNRLATPPTPWVSFARQYGRSLPGWPRVPRASLHKRA